MSNDNPEAGDFEERWPKEGDQLFVQSSRACDAQIVRDPSERFYRMPMGYKRAGDILIEHASGDDADRPNVVYAALFCYRQSVELFLKRLIEEFGTGKLYTPRNTHELSALWERFMDVVSERGRDGTLGLDVARDLVAQLHTADAKSDGFRFPTDAAGRPFAFGDRDIDLATLREVMHGLENFFECAYLDFSHQEDDASSLTW
jgi:hypothetical protein